MKKISSLFFILLIAYSGTFLFKEVKVFLASQSQLETEEDQPINFFTEKAFLSPTATSSVEKKNNDTKTIQETDTVTDVPEKKLIPEVKAIVPKVSQVVVSTNEPLIHTLPKSSSRSVLTNAEILYWTNYYRKQNGLSSVSANSKLDEAATVKVDDMFSRQYFEHVSPSGKNGADLITEAGYEYLLMGENLAYGNFSSAKDLVDAWMASPGHRANILKVHYEELGISVKEGDYNGNKVWMAVQEFGRPTSSCPAPTEAEKENITNSKSQYNSFSEQADSLLVQMNDLEAEKKYREYNELVPTYNALISEMNNLVQKLRVIIDAYNAKIEIYQLCAEQTT